MLYVVDYVPMIPHDERYMLSRVFYIPNKDIYSKEIITDPEKIRYVGYKDVDTLIVVTTNEYHNRPEKLKQVPNFYNMVINEDGKIYLKLSKYPYSGEFINYYYSGRTFIKGSILDGRLNDTLTIYYEDGVTKKLVSFYKNGHLNGPQTQFFVNGNMAATGMYNDSVKTGTWVEWFSSGAIKRRLFFEKGKLVLAKEDKQWVDLMLKAENFIKNKDDFSAMQCYENALELRKSIPEIYYAKARFEVLLERFDDAIKDLDKAISLEPFYSDAISERITARIRKYRPADNKGKAKVRRPEANNGGEMPKEEKDKLCDDITSMHQYQQMDHGIQLKAIPLFETQESTLRKMTERYCK